MRPERLIEKLIQAQFRTEAITHDHLLEAKRKFSGCPLYLAHDFRRQKLEGVLDLIREAIKRYDLRMVVFDNLHFLIRTISNVNEELGQAVQGFKLLAEEMDIPLAGYCATKKARKRFSGRNHGCGGYQVQQRGSCRLRPDDHPFSEAGGKQSEGYQRDCVCRETESLEPITLVRVEAHRYGSGGETILFFHGEYSRFDTVEKSQRTGT